MERLVPEKARKWQGRVTSPPPRSSDAVGVFLFCSIHHQQLPVVSMCMSFSPYFTVVLLLLRPCVPGPGCNDIQISGVICQVHFALGLTPGRSVHCVSRGEKHYTSPVFTEQFHPACMRGGLSSEPCLAFKCGKSAQSPPLTRNAARLSSWCSLNKLNNEGISEMPKRHYTPTIRARSE